MESQDDIIAITNQCSFCTLNVTSSNGSVDPNCASGALERDPQCAWQVHADQNPSLSTLVDKAVLEVHHGLYGINACVDPVMFMKVGEELCLDPQDLEWCRNLSQ